MKQYIETTQLLDFILPNGEWDAKAIDKCHTVLKLPSGKILSPRLFTIGKMIEILHENNCLKIYQENKISNDSDFGLIWRIEIFHDIDCPIKSYEANELADALWQGIKEINI